LANTKSALKARRVSERRHERNRAARSALRTYVKKARASISGALDENAADQIKEAAKHLDQAASKGIIHKNQAARRKSRLMHQLALAQQSAPAEAAKTPARRTATSRSAGTTRSTSTRTRTTRS
jgi:small subunit ribosomal protein S20